MAIEDDVDGAESATPQERTGSDLSASDAFTGDSAFNVSNVADSHPDSHLIHTSKAGWRVCVDMANRRWRFEKGSSKHKRTGKYRPLSSLPGGEVRLDYARANSERQKAARQAKRV